MTGTLSRVAISVPQVGHRERGATIDSLRGTRYVAIVRKLPMARPNSAANTIRSAVSTGVRVYRGPTTDLGSDRPRCLEGGPRGPPSFEDTRFGLTRTGRTHRLRWRCSRCIHQKC